MARVAAAALFVGGGVMTTGALLASVPLGLFVGGLFVVWVSAWVLREAE